MRSHESFGRQCPPTPGVIIILYGFLDGSDGSCGRLLTNRLTSCTFAPRLSQINAISFENAMFTSLYAFSVTLDISDVIADTIAGMQEVAEEIGLKGVQI